MTKTGLAFSGGGIRSAALCSGVLRRLLQRGVTTDFLSCVSGGGYTGTAYLDWKYRNEQQDHPTWHEQFFDHMRQRAGVLCNWQNPLEGIFDTVVLISLSFFVAIALPVFNWFSFPFPTAHIIDFLFGGFMRASFLCPDVKTHNFTSAQVVENPEISKLFNISNQVECVPILSQQMFFPFITFASLFGAFILLYFLKRIVGPTLSPSVRFLFNATGFTFAMVFLPWLIEEYIVVTPLWLNALIIVLSIFLWLGIPPLRDKASLALIVYLYAYAVKWKVYKTSVLYIEYTTVRFSVLMWISGILIWLNPLFGSFQRNAIHAYNRWRLQKAFYSPESTGAAGCSGITCEDLLFKFKCGEPFAEHLNAPLTLADLEDVSPEYICNVTVHDWRRWSSRRERPYELFTMAPSGFERIDSELGRNQFEGLLHPENIRLSEAMATSAAVVSFHMGEFESQIEPLRSLQIMLGLGMGKSIVAAPDSWTGCPSRTISFLVQLILAFPIIILPMIPWLGGSEVWNQRAVILFLALFAVLTFVAMMPTGGKNPGFCQKFVRWCVVNIYHVRFLRELMGVVHVGPTPPPVLYLSDGGHVENLGLLPLLKRKLPKIVIVDGGYADEDEGLASSLFIALKQAREKLYCSFSGINGRDVHEDFRRTFIDSPPNEQPRSYRFKVEYYNNTEAGDHTKEEGEILYILPRHPKLGISGEQSRWDEVAGDVKIELEPGVWGNGPEVEPDEVDRLTCCCCECCHCWLARFLSESCCGVFPNHATANQFFTPAMFSAYHREGYRACTEAHAAEFLGGSEEGSK